MAVQPARIAPADLRHVGGPGMGTRRVVRRQVPGRVSVGVAGASDRLGSMTALAAGAGAHQVAFPGAVAGVGAAPTPWSRIDRRVRARLRPTAVVLGTIVVLTMLGLVYLTQLLSADGARYAVDRLLVERQALQRTLASQEARIMQRGSEAHVVGWAQRDGLDRLDDVVRVRAR